MATSVRLEPAIEERLDRLAERTGRTKAYYLREMIESGLEDLEDYYLASATMENVRRGKEKVHSAKAVRNDLGLGN
jgi:RHH-type rel operon transcriptional repressor/antitoxin RelB